MEESKIDLHMHSNYSDGEYSPDELIKMAKEKKIKVMAITDHDTLLGNQSITLKKEERRGITIIPGIELSAKTEKGTMHILGYGFDINNQAFNDRLIEIKNKNVYSIACQIKQLQKDFNITFSTEDIVNLLNRKSNIGRPDLARLCIKYGYATTVEEAFNRYLISNYKKVKGAQKGISWKECIDLIRNASGVAVLAHPKTLELGEKDLRILLKEMIWYGLEGIEVYHSGNTKEEQQTYLEIAKDLHLLVSGGSDYHGPNIKPEIELGTGKKNNLLIKRLSILEEKKIKNDL